MPNPLGMANNMGYQDIWNQYLQPLLHPGTIPLGSESQMFDQGQFNPGAAMSEAVDAGGNMAMLGNVSGKGMGGRLGKFFGRGADDVGQAIPSATHGVPQGGGQAALGPDLPLPNRGPTPGGPGGLAGAEAASGYPTVPMQSAPSPLDYADEMAPLGPDMGAPNPYQRAVSPEDATMYMDEAAMDPGLPREPAQGMQDMWYRQNPGMPEPPAPPPAMSFMASSQDPSALIQKAAIEMIQNGVPPQEAIRAATMQFSDLLRP